MAVASECRMRLQEFRDIGQGILKDIPLTIQAMAPKLINMHVVGKPADAAGFAEIDSPTNVLASSSGVAIEHLSGSDSDNLTAGGHVQTYNSISINATNEYVNRTESMHATAGTTVVATTNTYKEVLHAFANAHGTGDMDAAGQVDIRKLDDTILVSIPAGDNESNGARLLVPDGHVIMLLGGTLIRKACTVDEAVLIRLVYIDAIDGETGGAAADRCINWIEWMCGHYDNVIKIEGGQTFESGTWIHLEHSSLVDAGEDYDLDLQFLVWKK